jgi:endogenous inhibitor of DNA gyrase (YacG/DUF329 family)
METEMIIEWTCPHCGTANQDDFVATIFPFCGLCHRVTEWDDILTQEQWDKGNAILDNMEAA